MQIALSIILFAISLYNLFNLILYY